MGLKPAILAAFLATALASAGTAYADEVSSGTYQVTFQEISNSCKGGAALRMDKGDLALKANGAEITIELPRVPAMTGPVRKGGKFKIETEKRAGTSADGRYSASGRVDPKRIQLVLVAELYSGGKPLCTQSWDVAGARK